MVKRLNFFEIESGVFHKIKIICDFVHEFRTLWRLLQTYLRKMINVKWQPGHKVKTFWRLLWHFYHLARRNWHLGHNIKTFITGFWFFDLLLVTRSKNSISWKMTQNQFRSPYHESLVDYPRYGSDTSNVLRFLPIGFLSQDINNRWRYRSCRRHNLTN